MQEDGEALTAVLRCGDVARVVVGYLADVIGDIGHMRYLNVSSMCNAVVYRNVIYYVLYYMNE